MMSATTLRIMTLSIKDFYVTLSKANSAQHYCYAEYHNSKCHVLFSVMLSVVMLNVTVLIVVAPIKCRKIDINVSRLSKNFT